MEAVRRGGDRQTLHERIRQHSVAAGARVKEQGEDNDLLQRLATDEAFAAVKDELPRLTEARRFIGRAPEQVREFLAGHVEPLLAGHEDLIAGLSGDVRV
jgi:adenylosuccinate lyase